jgi:hypothetical protein
MKILNRRWATPLDSRCVSEPVNVGKSNEKRNGNGKRPLRKPNLNHIYMADPSGGAVLGHSLAGIAGSNPAGGMDVCLL